MRMHSFTIALILMWMWWLPFLPKEPKKNAMDFSRHPYPEPHKFSMNGEADA
jgi:hypothetical protein